jgi:urease accessory protein
MHVMLIASKRVAGGRGLAAALVQRAAAVALDWDTRSKSRFEAVDGSGRRLGVFLPRGQVLRGGDVLVLEDGSLVRVQAAEQPVLRVTACPEQGHAADLPRAAYHLGNRHVPLEVTAEFLQLEPDPVLADMLRGMHLRVEATMAPFEPEGGAYATGHGHGHSHGHSHGHPHGHARE